MFSTRKLICLHRSKTGVKILSVWFRISQFGLWSVPNKTKRQFYSIFQVYSRLGMASAYWNPTVLQSSLQGLIHPYWLSIHPTHSILTSNILHPSQFLSGITSPYTKHRIHSIKYHLSILSFYTFNMPIHPTIGYVLSTSDKTTILYRFANIFLKSYLNFKKLSSCRFTAQTK